MMEHDLISVVVPVWNIESRDPHALEDLIDSLVAQSHRNVEIVLVDDGSSDRSGDICEAYAARDGRIRVFHTPNQGLPATRNYGVERCTGEYVYFADADDVVHPQCLEVMLGLLKANPDCDMVAAYYKHDTEPFSPIDNPKYEKHDSDYHVRTMIKSGLFLSVWNKLMRRSITDEVKHHITEYEDLDFSLRVAFRINKFIELNAVTYTYVLREQSACHSNLDRRTLGMMKSLQYLYDHDIKDRYPQYIGDFLWHTYATYINYRTDAVGSARSDYDKRLDELVKTIRKNTWNTYIHSDVAWVKKVMAPVLLRWPKLKRINQLIHYKDHK